MQKMQLTLEQQNQLLKQWEKREGHLNLTMMDKIAKLRIHCRNMQLKDGSIKVDTTLNLATN